MADKADLLFSFPEIFLQNVSVFNLEQISRGPFGPINFSKDLRKKGSTLKMNIKFK
jgi:hypothetical protein